MKDIKIVTVESESDKRKFIDFPYDLHANERNWVEPLRFDVRNNLDTKKNPFYRHAKLKLWLAIADGKIAGRIGGIINDNHNSFHNEKTGFFGFFECVNDARVAAALFEKAEEFAATEGMDTLRGPVNPSTNDETGVLVQGFESPPVILMPYNPPYYADLIENCGFSKAKDLYALDIRREVIQDEKMMSKLERITDMICKREGITYRNVNLKDFKNEVQKLREIYNDAWERNWGFVPMTREEFEHVAANLKLAVDPDFARFAEKDGKPIGFLLALPDLNIATKGLNGKLFPFGIFRFLANKKKINRLRVIIMGVKKEYQKMGIDAGFYRDVIKMGHQKNYTGAEISWVLEDNFAMLQASEKLGAEKYKTYRVYDKKL